MKSKKPNFFRCAMPFIIGLAPIIAALCWLHLMGIVHTMAKLPPPALSSEVTTFLTTGMVLGLVLSGYRAWADFWRGDYYFDLADWQERGGRRRW